MKITSMHHLMDFPSSKHKSDTGFDGAAQWGARRLHLQQSCLRFQHIPDSTINHPYKRDFLIFPLTKMNCIAISSSYSETPRNTFVLGFFPVGRFNIFHSLGFGFPDPSEPANDVLFSAVVPSSCSHLVVPCLEGWNWNPGNIRFLSLCQVLDGAEKWLLITFHIK